MPNSEHRQDEKATTTEENKKEFQIVHIKNSALYKVQFNTGGVIPKELSGLYTAPNIAQDAIKNYEYNMQLKVDAKKSRDDAEAERQARAAANKAKK